MLEELLFGIVLGCLLVSLSAIIVMGLAPIIYKFNRRRNK